MLLCPILIPGWSLIKPLPDDKGWENFYTHTYTHVREHIHIYSNTQTHTYIDA